MERVVRSVALVLLWAGCSGDASRDREPEITELRPETDPEPPPPPEPGASPHFRAEGAPDPLACEEGQCSFRPLSDESGCCDRMPPGTGAATAAPYNGWLVGYRREHCADASCPASTGWAAPERCETEVFCWQGQCRNSCDGVPDESSLPLAEVSLREAQRRAHEVVTGELQAPSGARPRCVDRPFEDVIVVGSFAHDRGCRFIGAFVGETFHREPRAASEAFLASFDWAGASAEERETMARSLVRDLLYTMRNPRSVEVTTRPDGSVHVALETQRSAGMRRGPPPAPTPHSVVIGSNGRLR